MMTDKTTCKKSLSLAFVFAMKSEAKEFINFFNQIAKSKTVLHKSSRTQLIAWTLKKPLHFCQIKVNKLYTFVCGVGKVNAAMAASQLIFKYAVDWIVNIGVVGTMNSKIPLLTPLVVDKASYHDFDLTPFNYALGQVPGMKEFFKSSRVLNEKIIGELERVKKSYRVVNISSGDKFVSQNDARQIGALAIKPDGIDMEIAAIFHVANLYNVAVSSIKFGSDYIHKTNNKNQYEQSMQAYPVVIKAMIKLLFN